MKADSLTFKIISATNCPLSVGFLESLGDADIIVMKNAANPPKTNLIQESYNNRLFERFRVLIVFLYTRAYQESNQIARAVLKKDCD
jgi:hypothetical protein